MTTLGRGALLAADLIIIAGASNRFRLQWARRVRDDTATDATGADGDGCTLTPVDLTGWTARMQLRRDDTLIADLSDLVSLDKTGHVTIAIDPERSTAMRPGTCRYDLLLAAPDGTVTRFMAGVALVEPAVSKEDA